MMINKDEKGNIKIFTRRLEEVTTQFPEVVQYVKKYIKGKSFILDSEAAGFDPKTGKYRAFQEISQRIKRKYDIEKTAGKLPVEVNVFDILYYNGKSFIKTPFKVRRKLIEKIIKNKKWKIRTSKSIVTSSVKEAEKFYKGAVEEGEEGVLMKNLEAPYKPGARVGYGIKIKPEENELDLVITGAEYGTGKRAGWFTSFDIACRNKNKLLGIGKVSTGLKEKESEGLSYKEMTAKLKRLIIKSKGRHVQVRPELVVTVTYQNIQKSPTYKSGFALRFPRFTCLRPDRSKEDIAALSEIKKEHESKR
jgi:DNA ligase-1